MIHVYGANVVYAMSDMTDKPVPIKQPCLEDIAPFGMGLLRVLTMILSLSASTTYPKH